MLEYFERGTISDSATKTIDEAVADARLKEEWSEEYMLTFVHDLDVFQDGYDKANVEIKEKVDALNSIIEVKI